MRNWAGRPRTLCCDMLGLTWLCAGPARASVGAGHGPRPGRGAAASALQEQDGACRPAVGGWPPHRRAGAAAGGGTGRRRARMGLRAAHRAGCSRRLLCQAHGELPGRARRVAERPGRASRCPEAAAEHLAAVRAVADPARPPAPARPRPHQAPQAGCARRVRQLQGAPRAAYPLAAGASHPAICISDGAIGGQYPATRWRRSLPHAACLW